MSIVFVYGSLKRGFYNHRLLASSEYIADFVTEPRFTMYNYGAFPAVAEQGNTAIVGELFSVSTRVMDELDLLEGYPMLYNRIQLDTPHGAAWMYVINDVEPEPVIPGGIWMSKHED